MYLIHLHLYRHGVRQMRTAWADGPEFVTQCPIRPGKSYTYQFTIQGQEGTLWWHAHSSWLRATVYGALIIRPKQGDSYPFAKPNREFPLLLGINKLQTLFSRAYFFFIELSFGFLRMMIRSVIR